MTLILSSEIPLLVLVSAMEAVADAPVARNTQCFSRSSEPPSFFPPILPELELVDDTAVFPEDTLPPFEMEVELKDDDEDGTTHSVTSPHRS